MKFEDKNYKTFYYFLLRVLEHIKLNYNIDLGNLSINVAKCGYWIRSDKIAINEDEYEIEIFISKKMKKNNCS